MTTSHHYPNRMGRTMLESMEEVLGRNEFLGVLNLAGQNALTAPLPADNPEREFSFETISALQAGLELAYGPRGGRGAAQRIGRAAFKYGLREFGATLGLTEISFRLLPLRAKLRTAGQAFADLLNAQSVPHVRFEETDGRLLWHIEHCPLCLGRHTDGAACHFMVGLLQESFYWLSSGKIFRVEETQCLAHGGNACVIEIQTTPLD
jgi:predicted hydrocarbon binding protein